MNTKLIQALTAVKREYDEGLIGDEGDLDEIVKDLIWLDIELEEEFEE